VQERIELKFPRYTTPRMNERLQNVPGPGTYAVYIKDTHKLGKMLDTKKKPFDCKKMDRF